MPVNPSMSDFIQKLSYTINSAYKALMLRKVHLHK